MTVHTLKTWPEQFQAVCRGEKTFEYRSERDRSFEPGDVLVLAEFDPDEDDWTGPTHTVTVGYVVRGPEFGVPKGYAVLSLLPYQGGV